MNGTLITASLIAMFSADLAVILSPVYRMLRHRLAPQRPSRSSGL